MKKGNENHGKCTRTRTPGCFLLRKKWYFLYDFNDARTQRSAG